MPSQTRLASFEETLYAVVGAKKETGKSADKAMSVAKRWRSHGATIKTPRSVVKKARASKGLSRVGEVIIWDDATRQCGHSWSWSE